jgi:tetratricopeptide (TPR) repeat protein
MARTFLEQDEVQWQQQKGHITASNQKVNLLMEKAYALIEYGYFKEAITQLRQAALEASSSPALPVILTKIADIYNSLGQYDEAFNELEKAEVIMNMRVNKEIA